MEPSDPGLSAAEQAALDRLVPYDQQTGELTADLVAAAQEALRRREQNTHDGGAVIAALYREVRSWRRLAEETGIKVTTARRWAVPPEHADDDRPEPDQD